MRGMTRHARLVVSLLLFTLPHAARADELVLTPRWRAGDTAYVELAQLVEQSVAPAAAADQPIRTRIETTHGLRRKIVRAGADGVRLLYTLERFRHAITSDGLNFSFDSDAPSAASAPAGVAAALGSVLGGQASIEFGPDGAITFFSGLGDARRQLDRLSADNLVLAKLRDDLDDDACQFRWGQAQLAPYAFRAVNPGDQWQREIRQANPSIGTLIYSYDCKFRGTQQRAGRATALIEYSGAVRGDTPADFVPAQKIGMKLRPSTFAGVAHYDLERGEIVSYAQQAELTVDVALRDGQASGGALLLVQKLATSVRVLTDEQRQAERAARAAPGRGD